jgi:hypothetical protein
MCSRNFVTIYILIVYGKTDENPLPVARALRGIRLQACEREAMVIIEQLPA